MRAVVAICVLALTLFSAVCVSGAKMPADEAREFAGLSLTDYVTRMSAALQNAQTEEELRLLTDHMSYYKKLHANGFVKKSVPNSEFGAVLDCVPFTVQPGLINAPASDVEAVVATMRAMKAEGNRRNKGIEGEEFPDVCDSTEQDLVPIARPIVKYGKNDYPSLVIPKPKTSYPKKHKKHHHHHGPPPGYSYVDSGFANVSETTESTHTILGVGHKISTPLATVPEIDFVDHSINQGWWVDETHGFSKVITLEGGWIACGYFTVLPTTTLFAFSTPNGYQGGNANQYNTAGGFVMYPGGPALANPVTEVLYQFQYEKLANHSGYGLWFREYDFNETSGYLEFTKWVPCGHYNMSRYPRTPRLLTYQTGQEIDQSSNSSKLTAAGRIFGWGTNDEKFPILGNFSNFGQLMEFYYSSYPPAFPSKSMDSPYYNGADYVHFKGADFFPNGTFAPDQQPRDRK